MAQAKRNNNGVRVPQLSPGFVQVTLLFLCLIGAYIRMHGVSAYYYNADEVLLLDIAGGHSLSDVLRLSQYETHPPLGNMLYHYWLMLSGDPRMVRAESLLFGLLLIPLYFRIGKTLNGALTGLFCAALVTFGNGCILQSYIVRNYALFLFLLSLGFYCYLLWRQKHDPRTLAGYALFFTLAALVHFSGAFALCSLLACETVFLILRRAPVKEFVCWLLANLIPLAAGIAVYVLWQGALEVVHTVLLPLIQKPGILEILLYPVFLFHYLLPGPQHGSAYPLLSFFLIAALLLWAALFQKPIRPLLALLVCSVLLGMLLLASGLYPYGGTRHIMWALPFVVPAISLALADLCVTCAGVFAGFDPRSLHALIAGQIILLIACLYSPADRFAEASEYPMPEAQWQALTRYLVTLDHTTLIVAGKSDVFQLDPPGINPYDFMGDNPFTGKSQAVLLPYYHTHILFDPYGYRLRSRDTLLAVMDEARQRNLLAGIRTLVIVNTMWQSEAILDLMLCPALQKSILTFPPAEPGHVYTYDELRHLPAALLVLSKKTFIKDVLSPAGTARTCFAAPHD